MSYTFTRSTFSEVTENRPFICTKFVFDLSSNVSLNPGNKEDDVMSFQEIYPSIAICNYECYLNVPPEDLIGADKLFAEARLGRFSGPLKLGALRTC